MKMRHLVAIAIAAYLLILVTRLPAGLAYAMLHDSFPDVTLDELDGTVWQGSAGSVVYSGVRAGRLEWETRPLRLLVGEWNAAVQLQGPIDARGGIGYSLVDRVEVTDATITGNLSEFTHLLPQLSLLTLDGQLSAFFKSISLQEGRLREIAGTLTIQNLATGDLHLGDFNGEITTEEGGTKRLSFHSVGNQGPDAEGALSLDGKGQVTLDLLVRNPGYLGEYAGLFRQFSSEEPDGYRFRWTGKPGLLEKLF